MPNQFRNALGKFPIRKQKHLDEAVEELLKVTPDDDTYWRARALLSYACMTAVLDDWDRPDEPWDELAESKMSEQELRDFADKEATRAANSAKGERFEYDCRWALAFCNLNNGRPGDAVVEYTLALQANEKGDGTVRDVGLLAEAADACVYLGRLQAPTPPPPDPKAVYARPLMDRALALAGKEPPPWFRWVHAWLLVAEAAQLEGNARKQKLKAAIAEVKAMEDAAGKKLPDDFDAEILRAVAKAMKKEGNDKNEAKQHRKDHNDEVRKEKKRDWSKAKEMKRSPFGSAPAAAKLKQEYEAALQEIYQD